MVLHAGCYSINNALAKSNPSFFAINFFFFQSEWVFGIFLDFYMIRFLTYSAIFDTKLSVFTLFLFFFIISLFTELPFFVLFRLPCACLFISKKVEDGVKINKKILHVVGFVEFENISFGMKVLGYVKNDF